MVFTSFTLNTEIFEKSNITNPTNKTYCNSIWINPTKFQDIDSHMITTHVPINSGKKKRKKKDLSKYYCYE